MPTQAEDMAAEINRLLTDDSVPAHERLKSGTLRVFGDWFGRPWDNIHQVVAAQAEADLLTVRFSEAERLTVWRPTQTVVSATEFRIRSAERVRWEWFLYGEPKTRENLRTIEHWVADGVVHGTSDADPFSRPWETSTAEPAAELL